MDKLEQLRELLKTISAEDLKPGQYLLFIDEDTSSTLARITSHEQTGLILGMLLERIVQFLLDGTRFEGVDEYLEVVDEMAFLLHNISIEKFIETYEDETNDQTFDLIDENNDDSGNLLH